jgi:hypothetical protein
LSDVLKPMAYPDDVLFSHDDKVSDAS